MANFKIEIKTNLITLISSSLIILLLGLTSCTEGISYEKIYSIDKQWNKDSIFTFNITKPEVNTKQNVFFLLRNDSDYSYSNIYLFVTTEGPDKDIRIDTIQYRLADKEGKWLGKGMGVTKENLLLYKENYSFNKAGNYKISVQQGMRNDNLKGITDIGLIIQKTDKQ